MAKTDDSSVVVQPNSWLRGCIKAPGNPKAAEVTSMARKVRAAITQA